MGVPCTHITALLIRIGETVQSAWMDDCYLVSNYSDCYSATIPAMSMAGKLTVDETFAPPEFKPSAGRPQKKRKQHGESATKRMCKACGLMGHYALSCPRPSTQYQYNRFKTKAIEWCQSTEAVALED